MAYVDLNPVRAGMAGTPEESDHTSIQERLRQVQAGGAAVQAAEAGARPVVAAGKGSEAPAQAPLMVFDARDEIPWAIPFGWQEYAELVDWTGRQIRPDKRGHIEAAQPAILQRLGLQGDAFADMACNLLERFGVAVGAPRRVFGGHDSMLNEGLLAGHRRETAAACWWLIVNAG